MHGELAQTEAADASPRTLGKYELLRLLARGGMGEVHLARLPGELGFEKRLVVKTIRAELAADTRFVELFAAEAKIAVDLSHPNIAPIYELGRAEDGTLYTAMGWVDGPSLQVLGERLRELGRPLEPGAALFIAREVLDGLAHAHTRDRDRPPVVHRDITPRNVLVDRSGRVQIVDFGIAKPAKAEARGVMGSAGYMAPEQARGETVDPRADVFSVGCVLYELLTNERAFASEGVWMGPDLSALPAPVGRLLERALALDPEARYGDADDFRRALAPVLAELAPAFGSRDLAQLLRELFPDESWEAAEARAAAAAEHTPATKLGGAIETFATRLRPTTEPDFITGSNPVLPMVEELESLSPDEVSPVSPPTPRSAEAARVEGDEARGRSVPWLPIAAVGAVLLAGLLGYLLARTGSSAPELAATTSQAQDDEPAPSPTPAPQPATEPPPEPSPEPIVATPTIVVELTPPEARAFVDGRPLEGPPYRVELPDGAKHELSVELEGHHTHSLELDPAAPPKSPLAITLPPLEPGKLSVLAPDVAWAEVWLDGDKIGTTPLSDKPILEGRHKLEVRCTPAVCGEARVLLERTIKIKAERQNKFSTQDR